MPGRPRGAVEQSQHTHETHVPRQNDGDVAGACSQAISLLSVLVYCHMHFSQFVAKGFTVSTRLTR